MVATVGVAMQFAQPGGGAVLLAVIAAQFPRMHFEEKILSETFPSYADYRARTARLIPGLY
jgi:protein-S-isoprenylcysteine O-methyltransferase Ste14